MGVVVWSVVFDLGFLLVDWSFLFIVVFCWSWIRSCVKLVCSFFFLLMEWLVCFVVFLC